MKGEVTVTDDNRILIILDGDWRMPQQLMRCLRSAGPDLVHSAAIHLTSRNGSDQPRISLEEGLQTDAHVTLKQDFRAPTGRTH